MAEEVIAWLVLRIVYAWMFLYPLKVLLADFNATVGLVGLIAPFKPRLCAYLMVAVMIVGSLMILFGIYAQIGGILLMFYCLIGVVVHNKLAQQALSAKLSPGASDSDKGVLKSTADLGAVGNFTSAQKNYVLAAVGFFFFLMGSGPWSFTSNLF